MFSTIVCISRFPKRLDVKLSFFKRKTKQNSEVVLNVKRATKVFKEVVLTFKELKVIIQIAIIYCRT